MLVTDRFVGLGRACTYLERFISWGFFLVWLCLQFLFIFSASLFRRISSVCLSVLKECVFKLWRSFRRVGVFITLMLLIDARTTVAIWLSRKSSGWACLARITLLSKREGIVFPTREYSSGHVDMLNASKDSCQSSRALSTCGSWLSPTDQPTLEALEGRGYNLTYRLSTHSRAQPHHDEFPSGCAATIWYNRLAHSTYLPQYAIQHVPSAPIQRAEYHRHAPPSQALTSPSIAYTISQIRPHTPGRKHPPRHNDQTPLALPKPYSALPPAKKKANRPDWPPTFAKQLIPAALGSS